MNAPSDELLALKLKQLELEADLRQLLICQEAARALRTFEIASLHGWMIAALSTSGPR